MKDIQVSQYSSLSLEKDEVPHEKNVSISAFPVKTYELMAEWLAYYDYLIKRQADSANSAPGFVEISVAS